jgi:hypothetical protein
MKFILAEFEASVLKTLLQETYKASQTVIFSQAVKVLLVAGIVIVVLGSTKVGAELAPLLFK